MNKYESVIIIRPLLTEDEIKDTISKYKKIYENLSDRPVEVETLGKKKLAYEIQGNKEGYYAIFKFYAKSENISDVERNYRIDDNIMKFITVRQEIEVEYNPDVVEDDMEM